VHEAQPQTLGIRLENLKPEVRSYVQKLRASLQVIYDKYEVTNRDELAAKVRKGIVKQEDIDNAIKLMQVINECGRKNEIVGDEVRLKDIPRFSMLPSADTFRDKTNGFKLGGIEEGEFCEGRDIGDFFLTDKDLKDIGFDDQNKRQELLQEIARGRESNETESLAKVFDIKETIAKKKQEDSNHPGWLTNKELFEAIDEAGYRPATLEELLAFGQQFWKPEVDTELLTDHERLQHLNAPYIHALSSLFTGFKGRRIPGLHFRNKDETVLSSVILEGDWGVSDRFLVVRKASS